MRAGKEQKGMKRRRIEEEEVVEEEVYRDLQGFTGVQREGDTGYMRRIDWMGRSRRRGGVQEEGGMRRSVG